MEITGGWVGSWFMVLRVWMLKAEINVEFWHTRSFIWWPCSWFFTVPKSAQQWNVLFCNLHDGQCGMVFLKFVILMFVFQWFSTHLWFTSSIERVVGSVLLIVFKDHVQWHVYYVLLEWCKRQMHSLSCNAVYTWVQACIPVPVDFNGLLLISLKFSLLKMNWF